MFARRDVERPRRWPLAWVWGPFVGGVLAIVAITFLLRAAEGFPDIELGAAIERAPYVQPEPVALDSVTDFAWDLACVIPSGMSREAVDGLLGLPWGRAAGPGSPDEVLVVFERDETVVTHVFVPAGILAPAAPGGDCRGPDDPGTQLRQAPTT